MSRLRALRWVIPLAATVLVAGCSSSGGGETSAPSTASAVVETNPVPTSPPPTPTPTQALKNQTYGAVTDLRDAAIAAGYACDSWVEDDKVTNAAESGNCSDNDVFCVYASESSRDAQISQTRANNETLISAGIDPSIVLFGPNWSINLSTKRAADLLRLGLGGVETK